MKSTPNNRAATRTASTKTETQAKPLEYNPYGPDVEGLEVIAGYGHRTWGRAVGFYKDQLVSIEALYNELEVKPLTVRQALEELQSLIAMGNECNLDIMNESETAQAKFYKMLAAALK